MSRPRLTARLTARLVTALLMATAAVALAVVLVSAAHGLATMYGAGIGASLVLLLVLPVGAAYVAALAAGGGRRWLTATGGFGVIVAVGLAVASVAGGQVRSAAMAEADAAFSCNGPHASGLVPEEVDGAWHAVEHPGDYWLYGPVSESPEGCVAAISGDPDRAFASWRQALLGSGWQVERDDTEVVVSRDGVRLTLYTELGTPHLHATTAGAGNCEDGRSTQLPDGQVGIC